MNKQQHKKRCAPRRFSPSILSSTIAGILYLSAGSQVMALDAPPPGFHRMPDGAIMANNPATAVPPKGYTLNEDGILIEQRQQTNDIPPGFHRMPDGSIMANNPSTAVAPPGYQLASNGVLVRKADLGDADEGTLAQNELSTPALDLDAPPPGFHRMPDGSFMANNPSAAVAPPGFHLMPDGTLMKNAGNSADMNNLDIPAGFHRMPNGSIMANNPKNAVAPPGFHLMPDGTLMSDGGGTGAHDHHHHHGGGHMHGKGMFMAQYRFVRMQMDDLYDTDVKVPAQKVIDSSSGDPYDYMMTPRDMSMDMHMLMLMYGVTDNIMLMAMGHYMQNTMTMWSDNGSGYIESNMRSGGLADTVLAVHYKLPLKLNAKLGISLPTGNIDERGPMQHSASFVEKNAAYPYGMQLGSGTVDVLPGLAYADSYGKLNWKVDLDYTYRTTENALGYQLGDKIQLKSVLGWDMNSNTALTLGMNTFYLEQIKGANSALNVNMSPSADATHSGGMRVDGIAGLKFSTKNRMWSLGADFVLPMYQNLWGPQMGTTWMANTYIDFMIM